MKLLRGTMMLADAGPGSSQSAVGVRPDERGHGAAQTSRLTRGIAGRGPRGESGC